jgi:hypothetical protein
LIGYKGRRIEDEGELEEVSRLNVPYCNVEYKNRLFVAAICKSASCPDDELMYLQLWCSREGASLRVAISQL